MSMSPVRFNLVALAVIAASLVAARPVRAQVTTGTVIGSITDAQGHGVAGAEVRIADQTHRLLRATHTDEAGSYRISELPPAVYEVAASAQGFRDAAQPAVTVPVDSVARVNMRLQLAAVTENVVVEAPIRSVHTSAGLGTVLDRRQIEALPLNGRNFLQLALLTPGVSGPAEGSELSSRGGVAMHANGAREDANNFLLDGSDNNDVYVNRYVAQPSVDSVQEFKVATNGYSAQYGRNAGGQINVVTRRGSNQFQGFAYEYLRNRALDSKNYFDGDDQQPFKRNEFGGGVGGPLVRDRTFFFGSVNLLRENQGLSRLGTVPTEAERRGNLSALGKTIMNPFTGAPFPGNVIPDAMISPVARQVLGMFPSANRSGSPNYLGQPTARNDQTQANVRIDHQISSTDALTVRYSDGVQHLLEPYTEGTSVTAGFGDVVDDRTWNAMAQHERLFTRASNALRFGANAFSRDLLTENHNIDVGSQWNVKWLNVPSDAFGYPLIDVAGYTRVGDAFALPLRRDSSTYQLADDLSIDLGRHLLKIGGDVRHVRLDSRLDLFTRGQLSFTGAFTGTGIGDLLLGLPTFGLHAQADNPIHMRTNAWSGYLQDDWRIHPDVTLNLGMRYEYIVPPTDARDGMTSLNPGTGRLVPVGTNGVSRSGLSPDRNNVAPRLGVSWNLTPATLVRGGYGVFYDSNMLEVNTAQYFNPPQFNLRVFFPSAQGLLTLADPFPLNGGFVPPATVSTLSPNMVSGYLQHWNVAVQRELPEVGTATVAYAGSKGSNLVRSRDLNQPRPGPGDVQSRSPYPSFSNIVFIESEGRSRFDSLQLSLDRPLARGVSMFAAYTLSKSMDDGSAFLVTPTDPNFPQNSHDPGAEWAPSSWDVRHRFTMSYIMQMPWQNRWARDLQIQGIAIVQSGQPFTPVLRFDNSNTGNTGGTTAGSDRPNVIASAALDNPTPERWFNTSAFVVPAPYTFGNAGRNGVRGPGFATFDVALSKQMAMPRGSMTFALQAFNVFNRTNFDQPEHFADEPATLGKIFSAKAPRQLQLVARFGF